MWRISILFVLLVFTFSGNALFAQKKAGSDTTYIRKFQDIFHVKAIGQFRPVSLEIRDQGGRERILYRPNARPLVGLGGELVGIGFALVLKLPESVGRDPDIYGNTRFHDFQFNWYQENFAADVQYQFYQGFYVSELNIPGVSYEQYMHKPDLQLEGYGLNAAYVLNKNDFSYSAAFNNSSKQLRSRGSFLLLGSLKHTRISTDSILVPTEFLDKFQSSPRFRKGEFTGFSIMPGYAQTFVLGDFYINLALAVGPDLQYKEYTLMNEPVYNWTVEGKMNFRAGIGYDNGKYFVGVFYLERRNKYSVGKMDVVHDAGFLRLTIGRRFPETPWMQDIRDWKLYQKIMNPFN